MKQWRSTETFARALAFIACSLFLAQVAVVTIRHANYFWDFDVYFRATSALWSGENPYAATHPDHPFRYVYPLVSLLLFLPLLPLGEVVAPLAYFSIQLFALFLLWNHWRKRYVDADQHALYTLFFILAFNSCISAGLRAGNVAILESALVWAAIALFLRDRLYWFATCIVAAACFKIVAIAFLGLLVLSKHRSKWMALAGGAIGFLIMVGLPMILLPDWSSQMIENITLLGDASRGALNPSTREFCEDLTSLTGLPSFYPGLVAFIVALTAWRVYSTKDPKLRVMLFVISLCLVMPRLKDYSYAVLILPLFWTLARVQFGVVRWALFAMAVIPTRYVTRYVLGIPDEEALRSIPFLLWEYQPLVLLAIAWGYQIFVLCAKTAPEERPAEYATEQT